MLFNFAKEKLQCQICDETYTYNHQCEKVRNQLLLYVKNFADILILNPPEEFALKCKRPRLRLAVEDNFLDSVILQLMNPDTKELYGEMLVIDFENFLDQKDPLDALREHIVLYLKDCFFQTSDLSLSERSPKFSEIHPIFKGSFIGEIFDGNISLECPVHEVQFSKVSYDFSGLMDSRFDVELAFQCLKCVGRPFRLGINKYTNQVSVNDILTHFKALLKRAYENR